MASPHKESSPRPPESTNRGSNRPSRIEAPVDLPPANIFVPGPCDERPAPPPADCGEAPMRLPLDWLARRWSRPPQPHHQMIGGRPPAGFSRWFRRGRPTANTFHRRFVRQESFRPRILSGDRYLSIWPRRDRRQPGTKSERRGAANERERTRVSKSGNSQPCAMPQPPHVPEPPVLANTLLNTKLAPTGRET